MTRMRLKTRLPFYLAIFLGLCFYPLTNFAALTCTTTTIAGGDEFVGISGSSSSNIVAVDENGILVTYDGTSWSSTSITSDPGAEFSDVYIIDGSTGVAVGENGDVVLQTGGTWANLGSGTSNDLNAVWAYSASEIYAFGNEGTIQVYNGSSWSNQKSSAGAKSSDKFKDAWGNSSYVYGLTEAGYLFRYDRSGGSWSKISTCNIGGNIEFKSLWGDASGNLYLAGEDNNNGVVYKYDGSSCSLVVTSTNNKLKSIYGSTATGEIYAVGKNGTVLYFNGSSWSSSTQGTQDLNAVWVDNTGVPYYAGDSSQVTTCVSSIFIDHFLITHDGTGLTCEAESITIKACSNADCSSTYASDVSVTLTPTGWTGGDSQTISGGSSTFTLSKTTAATYTLGISSSSPTANNTLQCSNTGTGTSSCDITYYDSGFIYNIPDLTSCATSASISVSAVRLDNVSQACVPTFQSTTKTLNFWSTYSSPASGNKQVVINNGSTDTTIATSSPGTAVNLNFNASGVASMTATYNDAGQLSLNASYTSGSLTMTGSDSFVSVPAKFYVYSDDANNACAANDASCNVFTKAGSNFNLIVRAACADNSVTPNFVLNSITLAHTNTAPAVTQGALGISSFDMAASDNGEHTISTQSVSEVGVFTFSATAPAYLGVSGPNGNSTYIGRFTPDHFCVSNTALSNRTDSNSKASCTDSFSYLSEDFTNSFALTAQRNGASCGDGSSTQNYSGTFSKFDTAALLSGDDTTIATETGTLNFAAIDSGSNTNLSPSINFTTTSSTSSGQFTNGTISVSAKMDIARAGSNPNYTAVTPYSNVNIGINPIDTDNIALSATNLSISSANYYNVGNTALYFGRLYADNTFGAEQEGLPMWAEPQYCNTQSSGVCSDWKTKTDDSCSLFNVTAPANTVIGQTNAGINGYWVSATDYSASSGITYTTDSNGRKAGWKVWYTAAGTGGTYSIPFVTHPYLVTQDGSASFGLYRGDDRIIYWQEIFN